MGVQNYNQDLPIYKEVDVVVIGGGPGGVAAALASANNGAKTMLIERSGVLGGNMSQGLVQSVHGYRADNDYMTKKSPTSDWSNPLMVKGGVTMDIYNCLLKNGGTAFPDHYNDPSLRENVDEEIVVYTLDQMMKKAGVQVLFNTFAFDAVMDGDKITGVVIANKSGPQVVKAKVVVDCSADGDIAARAGAEYNLGDKTGRTHGVSLLFTMGGINVDRFINYLKTRPELTEEERKAMLAEKNRLTNGGGKSPNAIFFLEEDSRKSQSEDGQMHMEGKRTSWEWQDQLRAEGRFMSLRPCVDAEWVQYLKDHPETPFMMNTTAHEPMYPRAPAFTWYGMTRNGRVVYDQAMTGVHECFVDSTNEEALSEVLIHCREVNLIYMKFFRERVPGFENAYILKTGTYGGRESRQIIGEYMVTIEDVAYGTHFDDAVAHMWRANNLHLLTGQQGQHMWLEPKQPFSVPYRALVPKTIDNLLVGGRCISKAHNVRTSAMVGCMQWGEAAGIGAALAVKENIRPRDVDAHKIQEILGITSEPPRA